MVTAFFPTIILLIGYLFFLVMTKKYKSYSRQKLTRLTLFVCYVIALIGIVFFPFPIQRELIEDSIRYAMEQYHNFIPFSTPLRSFNEMGDIGILSLMHLFLNVLLFIPLGFLVPIIWSKKMSVQSVVWCGFFTSLCVEAVQFLLSLSLGYVYRSADVDDLILNTLGTFMGYLLFKFTYYKKRNRSCL